MTSYKAREQSAALLGYLATDEGKNSHRYEIQSWLYDQFGRNRALEVPYLINIIRNRFGNDVVICDWAYWRGAYVYRLADSLAEVYTYTSKRTMTVRQHIINIVGIIDRGEMKFPDEDRTAIHSLRTALMEAAQVLENGNTGT